MGKRSTMGQRIQELRKAEGLTQDQLAQKIGVSMAAIRNYENGLREPNSKAMAALERYFRVSGEYLRGEIDRDTFFQQSEAIQGQLDELISLFQAFKVDFDCSSQERQLLAVSVLSGMMRSVTDNLLRHDGPADLDGDEICRIVQAAFDLNPQGRSELAKRAEELTCLAQYKK